MEEKLDLIIQKLDELLYLAKRIHKDTDRLLRIMPLNIFLMY